MWPGDCQMRDMEVWIDKMIDKEVHLLHRGRNLGMGINK
jgi:hypothetical protein